MHGDPSASSPRPRRIAATATAAAAACALLLGLAACAPEPIAGQGGKDADPSQQESSWGETDPGSEATQRQTELPESFPREQFPLPEGATIYDTGERDGGWFVVLVAEDEAAAQTLWDSVITASGLVAEGEAVETSEGGTALDFTGPALRVFALTIPQPDGTVLLNYELSPIG